MVTVVNVFFINGIEGSGKSTVARFIKNLHDKIVVISSDRYVTNFLQDDNINLTPIINQIRNERKKNIIIEGLWKRNRKVQNVLINENDEEEQSPFVKKKKYVTYEYYIETPPDFIPLIRVDNKLMTMYFNENKKILSIFISYIIIILSYLIPNLSIPFFYGNYIAYLLKRKREYVNNKDIIKQSQYDILQEILETLNRNKVNEEINERVDEEVDEEVNEVCVEFEKKQNIIDNFNKIFFCIRIFFFILYLKETKFKFKQIIRYESAARLYMQKFKNNIKYHVLYHISMFILVTVYVLLINGKIKTF